MPNTYTQINIQCVFAVKGRESILDKSFRNDLFRYMAGILRNDGSYPLAVGGWKDHVHVFFELQPTMCISDQMRMLKSTSSKWINDMKLTKGHFSWQEGYGAFSYSKSQRNYVIQYIMNQEEHHRKKTFKEEYLELLKEFEVKYDEKYLFEFYEF
jgi:putative transposase